MALVTTNEDDAMTSTHRNLIALTGAALLIASAGIAAASDDKDDRDNGSNAPALSISQVASRLETAGYRNITEVERERSGYEVEATNPEGARVELRIDGDTGEILRSSVDD